MDFLLKLDNVACDYDQRSILKNISFGLLENETTALLGPSGGGKTTLLRAIAGFEPVTSGSITLSDVLIASPQTQVLPERRHIGMVFQSLALFPHLNVRDNVAFGLKHLRKPERLRRADQYLELVHLEGSKLKMPDELSGGQQQRVALARSLAPKPSLLLMDEAFSSLDLDLRRSLAKEVREILKEERISCILVTHDQDEAFAFADKIGVINKGRLEQWDTPFKVYHEPCSRFVASFVGLGKFVRGRVLEPTVVSTELGNISSPQASSWQVGTEVDVLIRPDDVIASSSPLQQGSKGDTLEHENSLAARVIKKSFNGATILYSLQLPSGTLVDATFSSHDNFAEGSTIKVHLEMNHVIAFKPNTASHS